VTDSEAEQFDCIARRFVFEAAVQANEAETFKNICRRTVRYETDVEISFPSSGDYLGLVSGWACRQCLLPDGGRQILSFFLPGDVLAPPIKGHWTDRTAIVALTPTKIARLQKPQRSTHAAADDDVRKSLERSTGAEAGRLAEQIIRLGYKRASDRVLSLLLDFDRRLAAVRLSQAHGFSMPLKQSVLADALGLSAVHVNRTLQQMRRDGILEINRKTVRLRRVA
jgi:CRP-like cAMP-binding protein